MKHLNVWLSSLVLLLALTGVARADDDPSDRVARLSYIEGDVALQPQETGEWTSARLNRPLTSGDRLSLAARARTELQVGNVALHLDQDSDLSILELSDQALQVMLSQGSLHVQVRSLDRDEVVEVDTPNAAITLDQPGRYRIDVSENDITVVQVREGSADVANERQNFTVRSDEQVRLQGQDRLDVAFSDLDRADDFDRWADSRNRRAEGGASSRYVAAGVIGYEDLDGYGDWRYEADYGYVWWPTRVVSGWAPFRYGHWVWIAPWGWTWVDDAPWGFAPFHYGRWAQVRNRWCWVPGPRAVRPVYAPALVAWLDGPSLSVSVRVGGGPVGWVPLGPREVFRPYYRGSPGYIERVNLSNSLLGRAEFERGYRRAPNEERFLNRGAISVVGGEVLREARPVNRDLVRFNPPNAPLRVSAESPRIQPSVGAVLGGQRRVDVPARPERAVISRRQPMPVARTEMSVPPRANPPRVRVINAPRATPGRVEAPRVEPNRNEASPTTRPASPPPTRNLNRERDAAPPQRNSLENARPEFNRPPEQRAEPRLNPTPQRREEPPRVSAPQPSTPQPSTERSQPRPQQERPETRAAPQPPAQRAAPPEIRREERRAPMPEARREPPPQQRAQPEPREDRRERNKEEDRGGSRFR